MTGKERVLAILNHQPTDRIGIFEHFWDDTYTEWREQGHIGKDESFGDHFDLDIASCGCLNMVARYDFEPEVVAETEDTITYFDGNGATLKRHKHHDTTPEHIGFKVCDRESWEEYIVPYLKFDRNRLNFEAYRKARAAAKENEKFFTLSFISCFELTHLVCGHENMLMNMIYDPDWVAEMMMTFVDLIIEHHKLLFEEEGLPDGVWYYEDLGYKGSPFMSPEMYRDIVMPAHLKYNNFAKSLGLPIIMHSCGFIEPLLPDIVKTGIDCLQVIEVKAGMDLLKLHKLYGDKICFMGGIDVRCMYTNDRSLIDAELEAKIPTVMQGYNYFLHSDHSIPKTVDYDTYCYFKKKGLELGTYTK